MKGIDYDGQKTCSNITVNNGLHVSAIISQTLKANTKKGKTTIKLEIEFSDECNSQKYYEKEMSQMIKISIIDKRVG